MLIEGMMIFMTVKRHRVLKIVLAIVLAAAFAAGGYYIGMRAQTENVMSSLPRAVHDKEAEQDADKADELQQTEATEEAVVFVGKSNISEAGSGEWTTVDSCNYDITGDGVNDTITLYTSAPSDDKGILWEDSQDWILEVSDGVAGYYTLESTSISNGSLYFSVMEMSDGRRAVVMYEYSGSQTAVKEFVFAKAGFNETTAYRSESSNLVHTSIPWYK